MCRRDFWRLARGLEGARRDEQIAVEIRVEGPEEGPEEIDVAGFQQRRKLSALFSETAAK